MDYELMHEVADYYFDVDEAIDFITTKHEEEAFMDLYYDCFENEEATFDDVCMSDEPFLEDALYDYIVEDAERSADYVEFIGWQPQLEW